MKLSLALAGVLLVAAVCVDVEHEQLAEVGKDLQPAHDAASLGDGVQTMTAAEQAVFKQHMGEVIHKLLKPKLKSFPPAIQKLILGAIPFLLKGDIKGVKKFLFDSMKKEAVDRIMGLLKKLPDQGLKNMIRNVLNALIQS